MRLLGGLLVLLSFTLCGISFANGVRTQQQTMEAMLSLLRTLSQTLQWGRAPLCEVFRAYRDPLLEKTGFLPALRDADGRNYPAVWDASLSLLSLPENARSPLRSFGNALGRLPLGTQKEQTSLCIAALEDALEAFRAQAMQKRRSTVALWTLAGLLVAVLLL